jgi:hypothetical protein
MPGFKDLADLPEDDRIRIIGETCVKRKLSVGFLVDDDTFDAGKADRYTKKLEERFPRHSRQEPWSRTIRQGCDRAEG